MYAHWKREVHMRRSAKILSVVCLVAALVACPVIAASEAGEWATELLLGTAGGLGGGLLAITAIAEITPQLESRAGSIAVVVSSLTLGAGLGASVGVLAASRILDVEGNVRACLLGGALGGLASAFTEPLLYLIGIPEGITEFLGLTMIPILPAIGATIGFHRPIPEP
jgi:hypothetical protein